MSFDLRTCVVSILNFKTKGRIGTGFVVDGHHILTCAHVVRDAETPEGETVRIQFATNNHRARAYVLTQTDPRGTDIAVLKCVQPIPNGVTKAPLSLPQTTAIHDFRMFGYAPLDKMQGVWADGKILGETTSFGVRWLQLRSPEGAKGMSGAPVYDTTLERVVGIFSRTMSNDTVGHFQDTDFATPIDLVQSIWPELNLSAVRPQSYFYVPFPEKDDFVGREEDLQDLHEALRGKTAVGIRPAGLTGMGGIGKTQLAVKYVYDYRDHYPDGIFWLNAARPLVEEFAELGRKLNSELVGKPISVQVHQAVNFLQENQKHLLVLDNLSEPILLNRQVQPGLIPANLPRVLFTTRQRDLGKFTPVELKVLPPDVALEVLLHKRKDILHPDHKEHFTAKQICGMVGYLPLALRIAAAFLGEWQEVALIDFKERLEKEGLLTTLDEEGEALTNWEQVHSLAMTATLKTQWDTLQDKTARKLLQVAGQLPEAVYIPASRLGLLAGVSMFAKLGRPSKLQRVLNKLHTFSLIEELKNDDVRLHPLIREFTSNLIDVSEKRQFRNECVANAMSVYEDFSQLEMHFVKCGIDKLLEDFQVLLWLLNAGDKPLRGEQIGVPPWRYVPTPKTRIGRVTMSIRPTDLGDELLPRVRNLTRLLKLESRNLRGWNGQDVDFMQQIVNRIKRLQLHQFLQDARKVLDTRNLPIIQEKWSNTRESLALEQTLTGHLGIVWSVVVTSDGKRAVSVSSDRMLKVWNLETGAEVQSLVGHWEYQSSVALTPDGKRAVSASDDHTLKVWNLETGEVEQTLAGHTNYVSSVAIMPDGKRAVSASLDRVLKVWNLETGAEIQTLTEYLDVWSVAVSPDGKRVVSASDDYTLKVWNLETGAKVKTLTGHSNSIYSVAITSDGERVVTASHDRTLKVWNLETGKEVQMLIGHSDSVHSVAVTPDGKRAVSASDDHTLKVWNLEMGTEVQTLTGHSDRVYSVAVTPDGERVVSASHDRTLKVWNLKTGQEMQALIGHSARVNSVVVTSDGKRAVSASNDRMLKVWNFETGAEMQSLKTKSLNLLGVRSVAVTSDGKWLVSSSNHWRFSKTGKMFVKLPILKGSTLKMWNLMSGTEERMHIEYSARVNSVAVTPDGKWAVSASSDHTSKVWNLETGAEVRTLTGHLSKVNSVTVTPDGKWAVSASSDHTSKVWNLETGAEVRTLAGHSDYVSSVAVSPDGRWVVSASGDCTLKVWNLETGVEVQTLTGHSGYVSSVGVMPDGKRVVSASDDWTLRVWNLETGVLLATLVLDGSLQCVAVSPIVDPNNGSVDIVTGDALGNVYCLEYYEPKG